MNLTKFVTASLASAILLVGCKQSESKDSTTTDVIVPVEGGQDFQTTGESVVKATYRCDDKKLITARYINAQKPEESLVVLNIDGPSYMLYSVISASGAKYATESGLKADHTLVWWTKGDEASIYEAPLDHSAKLSDEKLLTECHEIKKMEQKK